MKGNSMLARVPPAMTQDILTCALDRWTLIWGDPALTGAVFMLAYAVAGVLAWRVARHANRDDRALWAACAGLLLFQVANTHLDLHAFPGSLGRCMARAQGWYQHKAAAQILVMISLMTLLGLLLLWVLVRYHAALWANILLTSGMTLSLGFTMIRGVSLHPLETLYRRSIGPVQLSDIIEMTGIGLVIIGALLRHRRKRRRMA